MSLSAWPARRVARLAAESLTIHHLRPLAPAQAAPIATAGTTSLPHGAAGVPATGLSSMERRTEQAAAAEAAATGRPAVAQVGGT